MWGAYRHQGQYYIIHKESLNVQRKPVYYFPMPPHNKNERLADQVAEYMNTHLPLNKVKPTKKEIEKAGSLRNSFTPMTYFASGLSQNAPLTALVDKGFQVGISAKGGKINKNFLKRVLALSVNPKTMLFFDSGAFSEIDRQGKIVKPINWKDVFNLYLQAHNDYGERLYVVAPDRMGDQKESLKRLKKWLEDGGLIFSNTIIPLQSNIYGKGRSLSLVQMYDKINDLLRGTVLEHTWIPAIPVTQKSPYDLNDVLTFIEEVQPERLHILGASPANPLFARFSSEISDLNPFIDISLDAQRITALVGFKDKARTKPRTLTELERHYRTEYGQEEWEDYIQELYDENPDRFDMTELWDSVTSIFGTFNRKTKKWDSNPLYYAFLAELYGRIPESLPSYKPWLASDPSNFELWLRSDPYMTYPDDLYPFMSPKDRKKIKESKVSKNSMEYWNILGEALNEWQYSDRPKWSGTYWGEELNAIGEYKRDQKGKLRIERNLLEKAYILSLFLNDNEKERRILQRTFITSVRYPALMDVPNERIGRRDLIANPKSWRRR